MTALAYIEHSKKIASSNLNETDKSKFHKFTQLINGQITEENRSECIRQWLIQLTSFNLKLQIDALNSEQLVKFEKILSLLLPNKYRITCRKIQLLIEYHSFSEFLHIVISFENQQLIKLFYILPENKKIIKQFSLEELKFFLNKFYDEFNQKTENELIQIKELWELLPQFSPEELYNIYKRTLKTKNEIINLIINDKISMEHLEKAEVITIFDMLCKIAEENRKLNTDKDIYLFHILIRLASSHGLSQAQKLIDDLREIDYDSNAFNVITKIGKLTNPHLKIILNQYPTLHEWLILDMEVLDEIEEEYESDNEENENVETVTLRIINSTLDMLTLNIELTKYFLAKVKHDAKNLLEVINNSELTTKILIIRENHEFHNLFEVKKEGAVYFLRKIFSLISPHKMKQLSDNVIYNMRTLFSLLPNTTFKKGVVENFLANIINKESLSIVDNLMNKFFIMFYQKILRCFESFNFLLIYYDYKTLSALLKTNLSNTECSANNLLECISAIKFNEEILWKIIHSCLKEFELSSKLDSASIKIITLINQFSNEENSNKKQNFIYFYQKLGLKKLKEVINKQIPLKNDNQVGTITFDKIFSLEKSVFHTLLEDIFPSKIISPKSPNSLMWKPTDTKKHFNSEEIDCINQPLQTSKRQQNSNTEEENLDSNMEDENQNSKNI